MIVLVRTSRVSRKDGTWAHKYAGGAEGGGAPEVRRQLPQEQLKRGQLWDSQHALWVLRGAG